MITLQQSDKKKVSKILKSVTRTIHTYNLIEEGDRIMVAVSGGKDSISLLYILLELKKKAKINFDVFAYTLDQAQPNFDASSLEKFYQALNIEHYIETYDTYSVVLEKTEKNKTYCSLCSRLRRGILYSKKEEYGATKLALGHHADDAIETLMLNLFYSGRMAAMSPRLLSEDKKHVVIRPLIELEEEYFTFLADLMKFPIIPCNLCNNQINLERQRIKKWLDDEKKHNPIIKGSLKSALRKVERRHLWDVEYFANTTLR